jgi:hypothetical protein
MKQIQNFVGKILGNLEGGKWDGSSIVDPRENRSWMSQNCVKRGVGISAAETSDPVTTVFVTPTISCFKFNVGLGVTSQL